MIHYTSCPICNSKNIEQQHSAKDHTVSQNIFSIWHCNACTARFTQDVPGQEAIGAYYASENYISHSDTKKGIINSLYHMVRKRTLGAKRKLVINETGITKGTILDIGCGTGAFLNTMQEAGWNITGLEPDTVARAKAAELYHIQPQEPGRLLELAPASFNAITMWHVLEHVHELHAYIKQIEKLLSPGGKAFIAVPNYTSKDAAIYAAHWAAYDVPRHLYHFSPQSMETLLEQHGLKITTVKPMWFDSFYVSMLSEQYKNGKGNIVKAVINGFMSNLPAWGNTRKCSSVIYVISK
ncbi:MAG: class I SAM-dependent methyltransferase [Chitinophagaceae bacterium]|nr:class I SAM-dependent methyltransferase [Chitinophagaceae bacterium]